MSCLPVCKLLSAFRGMNVKLPYLHLYTIALRTLSHIQPLIYRFQMSITFALIRAERATISEALDIKQLSTLTGVQDDESVYNFASCLVVYWGLHAKLLQRVPISIWVTMVLHGPFISKMHYPKNIFALKQCSVWQRALNIKNCWTNICPNFKLCK